MKTLFLIILIVSIGSAVSAHASFDARPHLTGRHFKSIVGADALLICKYSNSRAKFEILSQTGKCAPYLIVQ